MCLERYGLLVSCEHGGNRVPPPLADRFAGAGRELAGHRGWDPGALELATELARSFGALLLAATTSRLVVDLNRTLRSRTLFSEFTAPMGDRERDALLHEHYAPYREAAREAVAEIAQGGRTVVHVSVHTFTPVLRGRERQADVGLLYDPSRAPERALGLAWQEALRRSDGALRVRRNYPYRGTADGLATSLRREWPPDAYLGLELEVNQHHVLAREPSWSSLRARICDTLAQALPACADAGGIETRRERK